MCIWVSLSIVIQRTLSVGRVDTLRITIRMMALWAVIYLRLIATTLLRRKNVLLYRLASLLVAVEFRP